MSYLCLRICTYCITYYHRLVFWGKEVWGDIGGVSPLLLEPAALLPAAECFRSATFLLGSPAGFCSATARGCFRFGQRPLPLFWADVFPKFPHVPLGIIIDVYVIYPICHLPPSSWPALLGPVRPSAVPSGGSGCTSGRLSSSISPPV